MTSLLDFEHAGVDVRAVDLAVALCRFPAYQDALDSCDHFGQAYSSVLPLDPSEIAAVPALLELRAGVSLMHWVGRMGAGLTPIDDIRPRADRAVLIYEWVRANRTELVHRQWAGSGNVSSVAWSGTSRTDRRNRALHGRPQSRAAGRPL